MVFITEERRNELEGPLWVNKYKIGLGLIIAMIISLALSSVSSIFTNLAGFFFFLAAFFIYYMIGMRTSPRQKMSDAIEVILDQDESKFSKIQSWLADNNFANNDLETYERITLNLSTKYQSKFVTKSVVAVLSSKKAHKALLENGIIDKKEKDIKKSKMKFYKKDQALKTEVRDRSKRGNL